jgi:ABC-type multidrug transport system fused ATPase/permease subunit
MENNEPPLTTRQLWEVLHPFRRHALIVLVFALADTVLTGVGVGAVFPFLQALLDPQHRSSSISRFFAGFETLSPEARLVSLAVGTLAIFVAKACVAWATVVSTHRLLQRLRFHWVDRIGSYYLCGPFGELAFRKRGELLNDWFIETLSGARFFQSYLTYVSSLVLVTALVILGLAVEWRAMLALMIVGALITVVVRRTLYTQSSSLSSRKLELNQAVSATMVEDLASIREIKLMGAEGTRLEHLRGQSARLSEVFEQSAQVGEAPRVISEALTVGLLMAAVIAGIFVFDLATETMLPMVVFFSVAFYRLSSAVSQMTGARIKSLNELHSLARIHVLAAKAGDREDLDTGEPMTSIETDVRFRNLDYAYGETPVLSGIDATIPRGKVTFLVGPSGAGKSTLLDLLLRLMEPQAGDIEVNGRLAREFRLRDWRRAFGYVSQDVSLFNGTIRMNLMLPRPGATDAELVAACRLARVDEFVASLPLGYDTVVGDRGYSLSGGQRKRIAIARALMTNPSVLILDEATTSFEQSLERDILRGIKSALPDLAIVQVTHRVRSFADADWVIMLEGGRVVTTGPVASAAALGLPLVPHDSEAL